MVKASNRPMVLFLKMVMTLSVEHLSLQVTPSQLLEVYRLIEDNVLVSSQLRDLEMESERVCWPLEYDLGKHSLANFGILLELMCSILPQVNAFEKDN